MLQDAADCNPGQHNGIFYYKLRGTRRPWSAVTISAQKLLQQPETRSGKRTRRTLLSERTSLRPWLLQLSWLYRPCRCFLQQGHASCTAELAALG
jgi:hypothetical protein